MSLRGAFFDVLLRGRQAHGVEGYLHSVLDRYALRSGSAVAVHLSSDKLGCLTDYFSRFSRVALLNMIPLIMMLAANAAISRTIISHIMLMCRFGLFCFCKSIFYPSKSIPFRSYFRFYHAKECCALMYRASDASRARQNSRPFR